MSTVTDHVCVCAVDFSLTKISEEGSFNYVLVVEVGLLVDQMVNPVKQQILGQNEQRKTCSLSNGW